MANTVVISQGTNFSSLYNLYGQYDYINSQYGEGDLGEFYMQFNTSPPGIQYAADNLNSQMESRGIKKWPGLNRYTFPSSDGKTLAVRWQHGQPWIAIVVALIISIMVIAAVFLILWQIKKINPEASIGIDITKLGTQLAVIGLLGFALYLLIPKIFAQSQPP